MIKRDSIAGWVADPDDPSRVFEIVVHVDGVERGRYLADQPRRDLQALNIYGDGNRAFRVALSPPLSSDEDHEVMVRPLAGWVRSGADTSGSPKTRWMSEGSPIWTTNTSRPSPSVREARDTSCTLDRTKPAPRIFKRRFPKPGPHCAPLECSIRILHLVPTKSTGIATLTSLAPWPRSIRRPWLLRSDGSTPHPTAPS